VLIPSPYFLCGLQSGEDLLEPGEIIGVQGRSISTLAV
jgi:hypothetical protein